MAQTIRQKSLQAIIWIFVGYFFGALNQYFLTHKLWFSTDEAGLRNIFVELSTFLSVIASLGTTTYIVKFFPYYTSYLKPAQNDILGYALKIALVGFALTALGSVLAQPLIHQKFSARSALLVTYFYWLIPMSFFYLLFMLLESYALSLHKAILINFLKETVLKFFSLIIILLKVGQFISFQTFIIAFSFQYALVVLLLIYVLAKQKLLWVHFEKSAVTKKLHRSIKTLLIFSFLVVVVSALRNTIDGLVLASKSDKGLGNVAVYGLITFISSIMMAPYRSIVGVSLPILAASWKDNNMPEISKIYKRSSINLLTFGLLIYGCVLLAYKQAVLTFNLNTDYLAGSAVFFVLGLVVLIEIGTGVNGQIIGTSKYWRFDFYTSVLLTILIIPLSYVLTSKYNIMGPAVANLISYSIYNIIRIWFLWKNFKLLPFSTSTLKVLAASIISFAAAYFITLRIDGIWHIIIALLTFITIYSGLVYTWNISPDVKPVIQSLVDRFKKLQK